MPHLPLQLLRPFSFRAKCSFSAGLKPVLTRKQSPLLSRSKVRFSPERPLKARAKVALTLQLFVATAELALIEFIRRLKFQVAVSARKSLGCRDCGQRKRRFAARIRRLRCGRAATNRLTCSWKYDFVAKFLSSEFLTVPWLHNIYVKTMKSILSLTGVVSTVNVKFVERQALT